ncbi:hypothetical protein FEM48_Zijuj02G0057500 [Ziziphus jujuba var. spinosa]|uniref:Glycoside hydrolase family 3 N-terminal domain-containing protein n=1 Tax=Ziziphus jujuba var. spinosa TaxID=714518 RepID=A0A978VTZ2_ZIZJJ|nr:hypothetical protein FEM48_Zijuj02G0057500 [Ziziphus jujuba var. spinosa]
MEEVGVERNCIYRNPKEPVEARVKDLLSRMTLEEKIGQNHPNRTPRCHLRCSYPPLHCMLSACGSGPPNEALSSNWADMDDGSVICIFSLSGSNAQDGHLAAGCNGVKRHRTISSHLFYSLM